MEHLEALGRVLTIIVPIITGLVLLGRYISKSQRQVIKRINKIDKHKVSYKVCDQRRSECPCRIQNNKE